MLQLLLMENSQNEQGPKQHPHKWVMEISENIIGVEHPDAYDFDALPIETIRMDDLIGFEPAEKMNDARCAAKVADMVEALRAGTYNEPPIFVRKYEGGYQVIDGHHRFHAHRTADRITIEVRVVPEEDIIFIDHR